MQFRDFGVCSYGDVAPSPGVYVGLGTDAESALDDVLQTMQVDGVDVTDMEGEIKTRWEPLADEATEPDTYYTIAVQP